MKLSTCCGAETDNEIGICPDCLEHCDYECPECDGKGCEECGIIEQD